MNISGPCYQNDYKWVYANEVSQVFENDTGRASDYKEISLSLLLLSPAHLQNKIRKNESKPFRDRCGRIITRRPSAADVGDKLERALPSLDVPSKGRTRIFKWKEWKLHRCMFEYLNK